MRVIRPLLAVEVFAVAETLDLTAPARPPTRERTGYQVIAFGGRRNHQSRYHPRMLRGQLAG
jgi:hypothetical protein